MLRIGQRWSNEAFWGLYWKSFSAQASLVTSGGQKHEAQLNLLNVKCFIVIGRSTELLFHIGLMWSFEHVFVGLKKWCWVCFNNKSFRWTNLPGLNRAVFSFCFDFLMFLVINKYTIYNNVQNNYIIGCECAVRSLPPYDYVINQWTRTFIYNML